MFIVLLCVTSYDIIVSLHFCTECEELCKCCFKASMCVAGLFTADITQSSELKAVLKSVVSVL